MSEHTTVTLRDGTRVKAMVEPGQEPPVTRAELIRLANSLRRTAICAADLLGPCQTAQNVNRSVAELERALAREKR